MSKSIKTHYDKLFIGGQWETPASDAKVNVVSPHDQSMTGYTVLASNADVDKAVAIARKIRTGGVVVNGGMPDYTVPFGGFKMSGVGRDFGEYGLASFTEYKSIGY